MAGTPEALKFAEELHWCISQLELGLQHQSPDSRQAAETFKILKILKSTKAPLVKKRQAMRNALGDYRKKMQEAEKKSMSGLRHSRFEPPGNRKAYTKSKFLKVCKSKQTDYDSSRQELQVNMNSLNLQPSERSESMVLSSTNSNAEDQSVYGANIFQDSASNNSTSSVDQVERSSSDLQDYIKQSCSTESKQQCSMDEETDDKLDSNSVSKPNENLEEDQLVKASTSDIKSSHQSSSFTAGSRHQSSTKFKFIPSDNSFRFGFPDPADMDIKEENSLCMNDQGDIQKPIKNEEKLMGKETKKVKHSVLYDFKTSNNDFRFNFEEPSEDLTSA